MSNKTLFGHIATKFGTHPENLATEALVYILQQSEVATNAIASYCKSINVKIPEKLHYSGQVHDKDDKSIPDIVGFDENNRKIVIIENKFWASLTDNQPNAYLGQLPNDGVLIVIAPELRLPTLWNELLDRCKEINPNFGKNSIVVGDNWYTLKLDNQKYLVLSSWRSILDCIFQALSIAGDMEIANDTRQLMGLCDQMDSEAFLPVHSDELSPRIPKRIIQYINLIWEIIPRIKELKIASIDKLKSSGSAGVYGSSIWIHNTGCYLHYNANLWAEFRDTPLWLRVYGTRTSWNDTSETWKALSVLGREIPPKSFTVNGELNIPLMIIPSVEKKKVVDSVVEQIVRISELLKDI